MQYAAHGYGTASENNGNVRSQTVTVPALDGAAGFTAVQTYAYDPLNRIESARETQGTEGGAESWKQRFTYDHFGNRRIDGDAANPETSQTTPALVGPNPLINPATNRWHQSQDEECRAMRGNLPFFTALPLVLVLQLSACTQKRPDERVEWGGPNKTTNLVVFFKKGTTHEQIEGFKKSVLSKPRSDGRGFDMQDGMAFQFHIREAGYEGIGINVAADATPEQREKLKEKVQESPLIYKVLENVLPSDVKEME